MADLQTMLAEVMAENARMRAALAAQGQPKPTWKIPRKRTDLDPVTLQEKISGGHPAVFGANGTKFPTAMSAAAWTRLLDPKVIMEGLLAMRANVDQHGMEGMQFKDREEFEQFQIQLDVLIRLYNNLV